MRLLIDANIVFDVLLKREPYWADSSAVWKLCETEQMEGYISTLTFANLVYVMRKELEPAQIEDILTRISSSPAMFVISGKARWWRSRLRSSLQGSDRQSIGIKNAFHRETN